MKSITIDSVTAEKMANVSEFKENSDYNDLQIQPTFEYMNSLYLNTVAEHIDISQARLCDCGAGFGWLAFAFLLRGGKEAVIVEPHEQKLIAARKFAEILGLSDRCEFLSEYMEQISLPDKSVDIFITVETLEHVGKQNIPLALKNIKRLTKSVIILTTPNQLSPMISHDGKMPFVHWLPIRLRPLAAKIYGKKRQNFNHFTWPWQLNVLKPQFRSASRALTFGSYEGWLNHYPTYSPYGGGRWKESPPKGLGNYLKVISFVLGRNSYWLCPNLGSIWVAKK